MEKEKQDQESFDVPEISWEIEDKNSQPRSKKWYIIASVLALALITYALIDKNYFFALIIIIAGGLIVFYDNEPPKKIDFSISYDGVNVGKDFFSFESMNNFYIIYKPKEGIKKLFFEFKNPLKHRLSINLYEENPIEIRDYLNQYLDEDIEKEHEPLSEGLANIFKL